jgi:glutathione-regulated potassium-efflux system ancillary protein KefG
MKDHNRILILFAHPAMHKSRINKKLVSGIRDLKGITFHDLYENYPDFHIDVKREQELLVSHDIIVWHHPFYWYGAPSILKEWIDLVLEHGFAYGRTGKALEGKQVLTAITSGGRREAYQPGGFNNYSIRQLLAPFQQTVRLCNMEYLPPFAVHGTHLLAEADIDQAAKDYISLLISLRDNLFSEDDISSCEYLNDILEQQKDN